MDFHNYVSEASDEIHLNQPFDRAYGHFTQPNQDGDLHFTQSFQGNHIPSPQSFHESDEHASQTLNEGENKNTRKGNFSIEEDEALVRAWLHISEDAIVGRDQKSTKLWERILDTFHQILGRTTERKFQGLKNRWQFISHDVSKFCGEYNTVAQMNKSGWREQMKIDRAKKNFGEIEGPLQTKPVKFYRFKFEHCWVLLKEPEMGKSCSNSKQCA